MPIDWLIAKTLGMLLIPPGILLLALLLVAALTWRRPPLARGLLLLTIVVFYALSTGFVADSLLGLLEPEAQDPAADGSGQAIVVLGGGTQVGAPEYGGADTVNTYTLERVRYGAHLYRLSKKPVLTSGGVVGSRVPEAQLMKQVLQNEFQVPVQWTEETSTTTLENARASFLVLNAAGVRRVYLVTHAFHMLRSRFAFESAGFTVIAAPTGFSSYGAVSFMSFLPSATALAHTSLFFHEVLGLAWYHLRVSLGR